MKNSFKTVGYLCALLICTHTIVPQAQEKWITVFIHGSFSLRPHLSISNIFKMLYDTIEESVYYRSTEINRRDPFFYKNQAMSGLGLHKIDITHPHNNAAAPILAASFEQISNEVGYPASEEYYTFGWSGLISNKLRYLEAGFLYQDLERIVRKIRKEGFEPKIRLIGYSHGGNLALQLGALYTTKSDADKITIDELWLLGTPIQVETDYLINSPIFKKIYNFYSKADRVQTLDCFSFKRFFSGKKFTKRSNFKVPEKLYQIKIHITKLEPTKRNPGITEIPDNPTLRKKYFKEVSFDPGHFELWFMGWTILTYRQNFPFYPLPVLTFLPFVVQYLETHPQAPHDLTAHFRPDFNIIELTPHYYIKSKFKDAIPFVNDELMQHMKHHVSLFTPHDYNIEIYNQKVYGAMNIAEHEWKEIRRLMRLERKQQKPLPKKINLHQNDLAYTGHIPISCHSKKL
ncbi:hypothetical protein KBD08_02490 [Candidatus Babeliales bacterium]|nr:hypothetical protein [Candidatus Babeliales bacterium]